MSVIYFQLAIVATISGAYLISVTRGWARKKARTAALIVTFLWLVWTVGMVFTAPLFLIQAGVAIGTFYLVWHLSSKQDQLESLRIRLRDSLDGFPEEVYEAVLDEARKSHGIEVITGNQHFDALVDALDEAKQRLIILSGWVTNYVVDEDMEIRLRTALNRGVNVFIGFGWTSHRIHEEVRPENQAAYKRLRRISTWAESNSTGKLRLKEFPNHAKLVVCDDKYLISGSHNWLSNRHGRNFELSHKITDTYVVRKAADVAIGKFNNRPKI